MSSAIIDYASPASRSSLRLPARSEIRWDHAPGSLRITQVLTGRGGAVAALALAALTWFTMIMAIHGMLEKWHQRVAEIGMMGAFMIAEVVVGALVIKNTWRKTTLTVTPRELTLVFTSPLSARQTFHIPGEQVAAVSVVDRDAGPNEAVVAELEIRLWSIPTIHLFAGHPQATLKSLATAIVQMHPFTPSLPPTTADPPAVIAAAATPSHEAPHA